jgi:alkylation response protein AidB-like acyl-CoA dehydrogenase
MKDYLVEGVLRGARIVQICEDTNQIQDNELAQALITRAARH